MSHTSMSHTTMSHWPVKVRREIERSAETRPCRQPATICNTINTTTPSIPSLSPFTSATSDNIGVQLAIGAKVAHLLKQRSDLCAELDLEDGRRRIDHRLIVTLQLVRRHLLETFQ